MFFSSAYHLILLLIMRFNTLHRHNVKATGRYDDGSVGGLSGLSNVPIIHFFQWAGMNDWWNIMLNRWRTNTLFGRYLGLGRKWRSSMRLFSYGQSTSSSSPQLSCRRSGVRVIMAIAIMTTGRLSGQLSRVNRSRRSTTDVLGEMHVSGKG